MRLIRVAAVCLLAFAAAAPASGAADPAVVTIYPVTNPKGLMVTSGGWAYCLQLQALAKRTGYTLLCGRYLKDVTRATVSVRAGMSTGVSLLISRAWPRR